jgi:hypothetical protein
LDPDAVDFCVKTFGATPVYSRDNPDQVRMLGQFDLVWVGSLFTHLDRYRWAHFFKLFQSVLSPDGILVFTTHGRCVVERLNIRSFMYGLSPELVHGILTDYEHTGFGYRDYPDKTMYGISVSSPSCVCAELEMFPIFQIIKYTEQGWNQHQDVIACRRK